MELRLPLEVFPGRQATCRAVFGTWGSFPDDARASHCPFVLTSFTGWSSKRCPGIGFLSRGDREIGVLRNVEEPTRPRLECRRDTGLILRCDRNVGNPFQPKQGSRPSRPDQEGRKGSEEGVPENLRVPLEGDRDLGELCGSHQGCQVPFRPPIPNVGLLLRRCSGKGLHLAMTADRSLQDVSNPDRPEPSAESRGGPVPGCRRGALALAPSDEIWMKWGRSPVVWPTYCYLICSTRTIP